jgi:hypothetical protein
MTDVNGTLVAEQLEQADKAAPEVLKPTLYKFTNKAEAPHLDNLLAMFYQGVYDNTIGIMDSWNLTTEQEEMILVGVEADENGKAVCFPLARLLRAEEVPNFLAPDGKGEYFDPYDPKAASEAREGMKSIREATVE